MVKNNAFVLYMMLKRDIHTGVSNIRGVAFNVFLWLLVTIGIKVYVLPFYGVPVGYGAMVLSAAVVAVANIQIMNHMLFFAHDLAENRSDINYDLLLPVPSWIVFIERGLYLACLGLLVSIFTLPLGKLVFWNHVSLMNFSIIKFIIMLFLTNLSLGALGLWIASRSGGLNTIMNIWMRIIFPLWYLGGFEFSWFSMYDTIPNFAYLILFNPYTYLTEGLKSAIQGTNQFIPVWICLICSLLFIALFTGRAIWNLYKRLDVQ